MFGRVEKGRGEGERVEDIMAFFLLNMWKKIGMLVFLGKCLTRKYV